MRKKTNDEFIKDLMKVNSEVEVIEKYIDSKTKIKIKCKKCGHIWPAAPSNLLRGNGCPNCYGTPKKSNDEFLKEIKDRKYNFVPLEKYIDAKTKIKFKCNACSNEWCATPNQILRGSGCPKCFGTPKKTNEEYEKQFYSINDSIILKSKYSGHTNKVKLQCRICNYEWFARPNDLIRTDGKKTGCPKCAGNMQKTQKEFLSQLKRITKKIKVLGTYENNRKRLLVKCLTCGNEWNAVPHDLLRGSGCPDCALGFQTSFFEQCILNLLIGIYGEEKVLSRDKETIGMELDIYVPSIKKAIEPGGWFWHKDKIANDELKYKLCREKGIDLLTIYDDVDNSIKNIPFQGDLLLIHEDIGLKKDNAIIKKYLMKILKYIGEDEYYLDDKIVEKIKNSADLDTKKKNTKDFIDELRRINTDITVLGEYINSKNKIKVKCQKCNHVWEAVPSNLLRKHGCPRCYGTPKKTTEEYKKELYNINPKIEVIGEYIGARESIKVRCTICNHIWEPAAGSLLAGHGCPKKKIHLKGDKR